MDRIPSLQGISSQQQRHVHVETEDREHSPVEAGPGSAHLSMMHRQPSMALLRTLSRKNSERMVALRRQSSMLGRTSPEEQPGSPSHGGVGATFNSLSRSGSNIFLTEPSPTSSPSAGGRGHSMEHNYRSHSPSAQHKQGQFPTPDASGGNWASSPVQRKNSVSSLHPSSVTSSEEAPSTSLLDNMVWPADGEEAGVGDNSAGKHQTLLSDALRGVRSELRAKLEEDLKIRELSRREVSWCCVRLVGEARVFR